MSKIYGVAPPLRQRPPDPDPSLLCHPNIPKPLHGIAPRVICGNSWWDRQRQAAYAASGYRCLACGAKRNETKGERRVLEAHEYYDYNYDTGRLTFLKIVALCPYCHNFIHSGRLNVLLNTGAITPEKYNDIIRHGTDILKRVGLLARWESRHDRPCRVQWQDWRLVFEGKAYGPSTSCYEDWESGLWKDWKPTGKERSV